MTQPDPTAKKKKPRAKKAAAWSDPIVQQQYDASRRALAREASERAERARNAGRLALGRVRSREQAVPRNKTASAVVRGLGGRFSAVTQSWGLTLGINWNQDDSPRATNVSGSTNYHDINLTYPSVPIQKALEKGDIETLDTYLLSLRGVYYHEVGHNLYTVPLSVLVERGQRGFRSKDHKRFDILKGNGGYYGNRYPGIKHAWNVMEDQRMEHSLTQESPNIASYLTIKVLTDHAADPAVWGMISGRYYLSDSVRNAARDQWDQNFGHLVTSDEVADVTYRYMTAKDETAALIAVLDMQEIMNKLSLTSNDDSHSDQEDTGSNNTFQKTKPNNVPKPSKSNSKSKDKNGEKSDQGQSSQGQGQQGQDQGGDQGGQDGQGQDGEDGEGQDGAGEGEGQDGEGEDGSGAGEGQGDGEDGEGEGQGQGQSNSGQGQGSGQGQSKPSEGQGQQGGDAQDGSGGTGAGSDGSGDHGTYTDEAREAVRQATQQATNTSTHQADRQATNETFNQADGKLGQYRQLHGKDTNPENAAQAHTLIVDMEKAFETATANDAPVWVSGERRGILEPVRYRTRTPGDMEFYRAYADKGEQNVDVEVSCIFDVSGSMGHSMEALAVAGYSVQQACTNLGIKSQVVLYDTEAYSLWEPGEVPDGIPSMRSCGGTDPTEAFDAVLSEPSEAATHIVIIMTDGEWSSGYDLSRWRQENTYVGVFCYGNFNEDSMNRRFNEADEVVVTDDLLDIPRTVEKLLVQAVS